MAGAAIGSALPDCVFGRADGVMRQDGEGGEPRGVHRHREQPGRPEIAAALVGQWERRRQVLDGGAAEPENRGPKDAFVVCTDGLKGFPEAIEAVFPSTLVPTCLVRLIRASLHFVNWKEILTGPKRASSGAERTFGTLRKSACFSATRPHRLARPRTPPFHGDNRGSNPLGDAKLPSVPLRPFVNSCDYRVYFARCEVWMDREAHFACT